MIGRRVSTGRGEEGANTPRSAAASPSRTHCSRRPLRGRDRLPLHPVLPTRLEHVAQNMAAAGGERRCPGPLPTGFEIHPSGARRETLWTSLNLTLQGHHPLLLISLSPLLSPMHSSKQSTHRSYSGAMWGLGAPPLPAPGISSTLNYSCRE